MIVRMESFGYVRRDHAEMIVFEQDIAVLLDRFSQYCAPETKWAVGKPDDRAGRRIRIAAAVISDPAGRLLLVRKAGTAMFMQPGGKIEPGETPRAALCRELREEIGIAVTTSAPLYLGRFSAAAAYEPGCSVDADLFRVEIAGEPRVSGEIVEAVWVDPDRDPDLE